MRWLALLLVFVTELVHAQVMQSPKSECESLLSAAVPVAEKMLANHGEFFPYGYAMDHAGKFIAVAAWDGRERPPSGDLIQILKQGFREGAKAGKYRATALVYDVRVVLPGSITKSDAIAVSLNHEAKYAVLVFLPYRLEGTKVVVGDAFAQAEENYTFSGTK